MVQFYKKLLYYFASIATRSVCLTFEGQDGNRLQLEKKLPYVVES